jgi:hypothetical protein
MRKVFKNISVFFLWLAWLLTTAHMVIPHDHHLSGASAGKEESCPESENGHKSHNPIHCHAFNDLAIEKARPIQISSNPEYNNFAIFTDQSDLGKHFPGIKFISDNQIGIPDSYLLEFFSFRAPPFLS